MQKIKKFLVILTTIACFSLLGGCASVVDGTHQKIFIQTTPAVNATCTLSNDKGCYYLPGTPGFVVVHRSMQDLTIVAHCPGYQDKTVVVSSKTKGMLFGNLVLGGAIGAGVDCADGAAYDYPQTILIPMEK